MRYEIIISGFGGQGVMMAGTILCYAGISENKEVTFFPSYGAEMRGGTANCQVIISDSQVGSPVVTRPDILLSFNKPSFDKFLSRVKKDGIIFANTSLFEPETSDIAVEKIPANSLAEECGSLLALNSVMIGALIRKTAPVKFESVAQALERVLKNKSREIIELNIKAAGTGFNYLDS